MGYNILNAINQPILVVDKQDKVLFANASFNQEIHDLSNDEVPSELNRENLNNEGTTYTELNGQSVKVESNPTLIDDINCYVLTINVETPETNLEVLDEVASSLKDGSFTEISTTDTNSSVNAINDALSEIKTDVDRIQEIVASLSECDLRVDLSQDNIPGELGQLHTRLSTTISNLSETVRQTINSSRSISETTKEIVEQNDQLAVRTAEQSEAIETTSDNIQVLSDKVAETAKNAKLAHTQGERTVEMAHKGRETVENVVRSMNEIEQNSHEVSAIIKLINNISFQTNILALNAAVEAAHAGEHGRGFSIVAAEVRELAKRSSNAANDIKSLIDKSVENTEEGKLRVQEADRQMQEILQATTSTGNQIRAISQSTEEQQIGINEANDALSKIDAITKTNHQLVQLLATNTNDLNEQAHYLEDASKVFHITETELSHPLHKKAKQIAIEAANEIAMTFIESFNQNVISQDTLFDFSYVEIPNTNPLKHSTPYDKFCDRVLPAIQERILNDNDEFVYSIASDLNGYVPTHNNMFCKPLTGDPEIDLVGNRTKRIFSDRVGSLVGKHTEEFKLQIYRRDTGELMFDMSAPIYVGGEHWGGFRIGYRIE